MTETYQFEELDSETRSYLWQAREKNGKGLPGIFVAKPNYLPLLGTLIGFGIMIATLIATVPPTLPPMKEACLQTAGFLLGGWMVLAALRIWTSGKSGKFAGHFVYADADYLYEGNGGVVYITELTGLRDAKAAQILNDGKYQSTSITIKVGHDRRTLHIPDEERARRMTAFLDALCYMREGGDDGTDEDLKKLPPETMGAVAKQVSRTGEFPSNPTTATEGEVVHVPRPQRDRRRSTGLLAMLMTIAAGVLMFLGFRSIDGPLRDDAIFDEVKTLGAKDQPPALRLYLANPDFTAHRDEAQQMLDTFYAAGVGNNIKGSDDDLKKAISEVVLSLKTKPQPVVSFIAAEEAAPAGQDAAAGGRESKVQQQLADKWGSTIGDELVVFAAPADPNNPNATDKSAKAMIELRWKFTQPRTIEYTIQFRTSPDQDPIASKQATVSLDPMKGAVAEPERVEKLIQAMIDDVLQKTIGGVKNRPPPPPADF